MNVIRCAAVLALIPLTSCSLRIGGMSWGWSETTDWVEETRTMEMDAADLKVADVETHNGNITIRGDAQASKVSIVAHVKAGGDSDADAQAALAALSVFADASGDEAEIGWRWSESKGSAWSGSVRFEIVLPESMALDVETHNGHVEIVEVHGALELETHNGRIRASSATPTVDVATHNGGIKLELAASSVGGGVHTHNGSIHLDLRDDVSARIDCETHNGGITCRHTLKDLETSRNSLSGTIGEGGSELTVSTHNGSITVE